MVIKVCDSIMGSGKSQGCIHMMQSNPTTKYLYITPRCTEVERIRKACGFVEPETKFGSKQKHLQYLISSGKSIASTHKLFSMFNDETIDIIRNAGYTLVLDEVIEVVKPLKIGVRNTQMLFDNGVLALNASNRVIWADDEYTEPWGQELKPDIKQNYVYLEDDRLMYWTYPNDVFSLFNETYILTYMFDKSLLKAYLDVYGYTFEYFGTRKVDDHYEFCDVAYAIHNIPGLDKKIHVLEAGKVNEAWDDRTALSSTKQKQALKQGSSKTIEKLRKNLWQVINYHFKKSGCTSDLVMWSCFTEAQEMLSGDGYSDGFLVFNCNAVNDYADKRWLAYCVNIFYSPEQKWYFSKRNVNVSDDGYALSTMVQWVWRSAIRNGEEIWIYIPSKRMRNLFKNWLKEVSERNAV